ncbi:MAG: NAD-dependent protein deacetylase [Ignavibacteriaceae bacterium]
MNLSDEFLQKLNNSNSIVFFSGAGISAESGIPTFRGEDGIWKKLKPEELANFDAFLRNPDMVWEWYQHRKKITRESRPNAGHLAIAEFEKYFPQVSVITQNIDNLHRRAGSKTVYELHGNIERNYCIKCHKFYNELPEFTGKVPKCNCGGLIRPDVVWFGEFLPQDQFSKAEAAASSCDMFFIVGTSAVVYPAAGLIYTARRYGAYLVEINIEETDISSIVDFSIPGKAGTVLPYILNSIKSGKQSERNK